MGRSTELLCLKMEHTRRASYEGWRMVAVLTVVAPILYCMAWVFDMGIIWQVTWTLIITLVAVLVAAYAIANIRSKGTFSCRLSDDDLTQITPTASCGESFQVKLSEITQIEIHDGGSEGPCDEWYIHAKGDRYRISSNYGNTNRKFGEAIQRALPHIKTIKTQQVGAPDRYSPRS